MARLGRRQPFKPIIQGAIKYAEPTPPVWTQYVVSRQANADAAQAFFEKRTHIIIGKFKAGLVLPPPPVGKQTIVTLESVRRAALKRTDVYTPFIQTIRPPDPIRIPVLVQTDPRAQIRQREHNDLVAAILNSLIMQRKLVRISGETARGTWKLGYVPDVTSDWANPPPTTLDEAVDRIAAVLKTLGSPP